MEISNIPKEFRGYEIPIEDISFNLKSTLAQLGVESSMVDLNLSPKLSKAIFGIEIWGINSLGKA